MKARSRLILDLSLSVSLLCVLSGCGADATSDRDLAADTAVDTTTDASPSAPADLHAACTAIAEARCGAIASCCTDLASRFPDSGLPIPVAVTRCQAETTAACAAAFRSAWPALRAATQHVDQAAAVACVTATKTAAKACVPPTKTLLDRSCAVLVAPPTAAAGAVCGPPSCPVDLRCRPVKPGDPQLRCAAPATVGQPCRVGADCVAGAICGPSAVCVMAASEGQVCVGVNTCAPGLACDDRIGRCIRRLAIAAVCLAHRHCQEGLLCAGLRLAGRCEPRVKIDQACVADTDCSDGSFCRTTGTCAALLGVGQTCSRTAQCALKSYCAGQPQRCTLLPSVGAPCAFSARICQPGLTCYQPSKQDRTCVTLRNKGQKCSQQNNCSVGLGCQGGRCVDLPQSGEPCLDGLFCRIGFCDQSVKKQSICRPFLAVNSTCIDSYQCAPTATCLGTSVSTLVCRPLPGNAEACLQQCTAGLRCVLKKQPGRCVSRLCNGG